MALSLLQAVCKAARFTQGWEPASGNETVSRVRRPQGLGDKQVKTVSDELGTEDDRRGGGGAMGEVVNEGALFRG